MSIQFIGLFSTMAYRVVLTVALASGVGIFFHQAEAFLAARWWRLREPSDQELARIAPAWLAVCRAAADVWVITMNSKKSVAGVFGGFPAQN
jgi:hypothetical protein